MSEINVAKIEYYNPDKGFGFLITRKPVKIYCGGKEELYTKFFFNSDNTALKKGDLVNAYIDGVQNITPGKAPRTKTIRPYKEGQMIINYGGFPYEYPTIESGDSIYQIVSSDAVKDMLSGEIIPAAPGICTNRYFAIGPIGSGIFGSTVKNNNFIINGVKYACDYHEDYVPVIIDDKALTAAEYEKCLAEEHANKKKELFKTILENAEIYNKYPAQKAAYETEVAAAEKYDEQKFVVVGNYDGCCETFETKYTKSEAEAEACRLNKEEDDEYTYYYVEFYRREPIKKWTMYYNIEEKELIDELLEEEAFPEEVKLYVEEIRDWD